MSQVRFLPGALSHSDGGHSKQTPDAEFFKGLSQLGAGYVHFQRGNLHGAKTLLRRGAGRIDRYEDGHRGIPKKELARATLADAESIEAAEQAGRIPPAVTFPKV